VCGPMSTRHSVIRTTLYRYRNIVVTFCDEVMAMMQTVCGRVPFFVVFVGGLLGALTSGVVGGVVQQVEYVWTTGEVNYTSSGQRLTGSVTATYDNAYLVTQCAFRCLQTTADQCASYNFLPAQRKCELNSASHQTSPNSLLPVDNSQYYLRTAFTIDKVTTCRIVTSSLP